MTGVIEEIDLTSRPDRTEAQETLLRPGLQLAVQITVLPAFAFRPAALGMSAATGPG